MCIRDRSCTPSGIDPLFKEEGQPTGFGYVDVCKDAQESIDRLNNDIEINARWGARPRWFIRGDGAITEEEYTDLSKVMVHVDSNLGDDSLRRIETQAVSSVYLTVLNLSLIHIFCMKFSAIENGRNSLSEQTAISICREFHANYDYLIYEDGEMFDDLDVYKRQLSDAVRFLFRT